MSLKTIYLSELNALAKGVPAGKNTQEIFTEKLRTVIVDGSRDPGEYEPADTGALAWKEVAPRGLPVFHASVLEILGRLGTQEEVKNIDFPFSHAVVKMTSNIAMSGQDSDRLLSAIRKELLGLLGQIPTEQNKFVAQWNEGYEKSMDLWFDTMLLAFELHSKQPDWLGAVWTSILKQPEQSEKRERFLEHCACISPDWITKEKLLEHIEISGYDGAGLRRFFYLLACSLEMTPNGKTQLATLTQNGDATRRDSDLFMSKIMQSEILR